MHAHVSLRQQDQLLLVPLQLSLQHSHQVHQTDGLSLGVQGQYSQKAGLEGQLELNLLFFRVDPHMQKHDLLIDGAMLAGQRVLSSHIDDLVVELFN